MKSCVENKVKLGVLDELRTSKIDQFDHLFYERDYLFGKFMTAQKLAISFGN